MNQMQSMVCEIQNTDGNDAYALRIGKPEDDNKILCMREINRRQKNKHKKKTKQREGKS